MAKAFAQGIGGGGGGGGGRSNVPSGGKTAHERHRRRRGRRGVDQGFPPSLTSHHHALKTVLHRRPRGGRGQGRREQGKLTKGSPRSRSGTATGAGPAVRSLRRPSVTHAATRDGQHPQCHPPTRSTPPSRSGPLPRFPTLPASTQGSRASPPPSPADAQQRRRAPRVAAGRGGGVGTDRRRLGLVALGSPVGGDTRAVRVSSH